MMKFALVLCALVVVPVDSAPAIVWSFLKKTATKHNSVAIDAASVISSAVKDHVDEDNTSGTSLESVIFVVGRGDDGSEAFTELAASGNLPEVSKKYNDACTVHHNVNQVVSTKTIAEAARDAVPSLPRGTIIEASLDEFHKKLSSDQHEDITEERTRSNSEKHARKRSRTLSNARVLVVKVSPKDAEKLDDAVSKAVDSVKSVILTAIRSTKEVIDERKMIASRKLEQMQTEALNRRRRRLEDADFDDNYQEDEDTTGVYYVNMTPNILAGLLFTFFFIFVAITGFSCLNMIQGQDVYVKKLPAIGREA